MKLERFSSVFLLSLTDAVSAVTSTSRPVKRTAYWKESGLFDIQMNVDGCY
jgi:hypothetical protein